MKTFYRRNLPHIQPPGGKFFVTFRLAGTLPAEVVRQLMQERARKRVYLATAADEAGREVMLYEEEKWYFARYDQLLDKADFGSTWLSDNRVAALISEKLINFDGSKYELICYCLMPNHVHLLFDLDFQEALPPSIPAHKGKTSMYAVTDILRLIKGATARGANQVLDSSGGFWHHESYDHLVRDQKEERNIIHYILNNPVKAGLVKEWQNWPWTYLKPGYL